MKTPEEIFDEAIQAKGLDIVSVKDADLYEAGLEAIKRALSIANVSNNEVACCGNCHLPLDKIEIVPKIQIADKKFNS